MENNNKENEIEQQETASSEPGQSQETTETTETPEPVETSEVVEQPEIKEVPPEKTEKPEPTRFQKFLHNALIWLAIIVIAFGAGFLLDHFLRYQPLKEDLRQAQEEQVNLQNDLDELDALIEQLRPKLEAANTRISSLEEDLEMANARSQLYQVLVDVSSARLALSLEDFEAAEEALVDTQTSLESLGPVIEKVDADLAVSLPRRLELITNGLSRNPETATIDLELFTKDLLELEPLLFED